ncbi:MAG: hypothetical protein GC164_10855 [Phycisphaera sp.]|nr:hypothetical protein [Phycisphaera sp.]
MALFGRESPSDHLRALRVKAWLNARSPYALFCAMFGCLAVLDAFTGVLGVVFGVIAWVLSVQAGRQLKSQPTLKGHRLRVLGLVTGLAGIALGVAVWCYWY